jgi:hypothetical protein
VKKVMREDGQERRMKRDTKERREEGKKEKGNESLLANIVTQRADRLRAREQRKSL